MKPSQITGLIFLVCVNFIFTACADSRATALRTDESADLRLPTPTPKADFSIPEGWVLFPAPKPESDERTCANHTIELERKVELIAGNLKISRYIYNSAEPLGKLPEDLRKIVAGDKTAKGYLHIEPFENGWLIGADAGEWGGDLFWLSSDGKSKTELLKDNVRGIVRLGKEVFILSGLAHLSIDEGKLYKLKTGENAALKVELVSDLKSQPQTFAVETDESFVVTLNNKILRVKITGEIETLKETNFDYLYPNSMAVTPAGIIYVGMRFFTVRFMPQKNGYAEEWLVPQNCQKFVEKDFDCVCRNAK